MHRCDCRDDIRIYNRPEDEDGPPRRLRIPFDHEFDGRFMAWIKRVVENDPRLRGDWFIITTEKVYRYKVYAVPPPVQSYRVGVERVDSGCEL